MSNDEKLDKILSIVTKIQIQTAVQQEQINNHRSYFKYIAGTLTTLAIILITAIVKVVV